MSTISNRISVAVAQHSDEPVEYQYAGTHEFPHIATNTSGSIRVCANRSEGYAVVRGQDSAGTFQVSEDFEGTSRKAINAAVERAFDSLKMFRAERAFREDALRFLNETQEILVEEYGYRVDRRGERRLSVSGVTLRVFPAVGEDGRSTGRAAWDVVAGAHGSAYAGRDGRSPADAAAAVAKLVARVA